MELTRKNVEEFKNFLRHLKQKEQSRRSANNDRMQKFIGKRRTRFENRISTAKGIFQGLITSERAAFDTEIESLTTGYQKRVAM